MKLKGRSPRKGMAMTKLRQGLWRAWVVVSLAWIVGICAVHGPRLVQVYDESDGRNAGDPVLCGSTRDPSPGAASCYDRRLEIGVSAAGLLMVPPAILLITGLSVAWIVKIFRYIQ